MAESKYLDLAGLQVFKGLIEGEISDGDAKALKTVKIDGQKLQFFKSESPIEGATSDLEITLPSQDLSGLLEKISGGVVGNVVTIGADGIVIDSGVKIDDIATKSEVTAVDAKVGDITTLDTTSKTDVVGAVNELKGAIESSQTAGAITIDTTTTTEGYLKSYTIKQGGNTIGVVDIPKDLVVTSGEVVVNPEGQTAGTYIKLVIANQDEPLYINVGTLVDIYIAKASATQIQIAIDSSTREISATIVAGSVSSTELASDAVTTVKIADANVTLAKLASDVVNAFDAAGSANAAETNSKTYADGLNTAMDTRVSNLESKVGEGYTAITVDEINAMFTPSK